MKKVYFLMILVALLFNGCTASTWFLVDSYGIMTYDRFTGKWELLWEFKTKKPVGDSIQVIASDSLVSSVVK